MSLASKFNLPLIEMIIMWYCRKIQYSCYYYVLILVLLLMNRVNSSSSTSSSAHSNPSCSALLQFKASLSVDSDPFNVYYDYCGDSSPKIMSWNQSTNCCGWEGVTCDNSNVIGLDLSCSRLYANTTTSLLQLLPKTLQRLNLAFNSFNGSIPSQLFTHLVSLTHLNLSSCLFAGSIPSEISLLTHLVSLDLSSNRILIFDSFDMFARSNSSSSKLATLFLDHVDMSSAPPSSLLNLTSLQALSLINCGLNGELPSETFRLPYLQYVDLSSNYGITGHLPQSNWTSPIEVLHLSDCDFRGPLPASLGNLTRITSLDLSNNLNFGGEIPNVFGSLRQLGGELRLGSSDFSGQLPSTIFNLTLITTLDLSNNSLQGGFPHMTSTIGGPKSLEQLDLSSNLITGGLPYWLFANFPSLKYLLLSNNKLTGPIPSISFDVMNELIELNLSSNELEGVITSKMLSKPKKLVELELSNNFHLSLSDSGHADIVNHTFPELYMMWFSSCNVTRFPNFLSVANKLTYLDLSRNKIQGSISEWGSQGQGWKELTLLDLSYNLLTSYNFDQFPRLKILDLRSNQLQGPILALPTSIQTLFISRNNLRGEIPPLFCNMSFEYLDLSRNNLSGIIPSCLVNSTMNSITINLQMNHFYGKIPAFESASLQYLLLNDNQLEGPVPRSLVNCTSLFCLSLANNYLNDTFPHWLGVLPSLQSVFLGSNRFHGSLENFRQTCAFPLHIIDISQNHFTGLLPTQLFRCLVANMLLSAQNVSGSCHDYACSWSRNYNISVKVTMKRLQFEVEEGSIPYDFTLIDFSNNHFHGSIPDVVGELVGLHVLNLSHNYLTGSIPPSLGNMQALESLDLSSNKLWGIIPYALTNLSFLEVFNLSQNNLEGPIPVAKQFNTFDNDSYGGNPRLCGSPLSKKCGNIPEPPPSSSTAADREDDSGIPFIWKVVVMGYGSGVVLGLSIGYIVFTTGRPWWIVRKIERDWKNNVTKWFRRFGIGGGRRRRN